MPLFRAEEWILARRAGISEAAPLEILAMMGIRCRAVWAIYILSL